jgi:hypothetical protein
LQTGRAAAFDIYNKNPSSPSLARSFLSSNLVSLLLFVTPMRPSCVEYSLRLKPVEIIWDVFELLNKFSFGVAARLPVLALESSVPERSGLSVNAREQCQYQLITVSCNRHLAIVASFAYIPTQ